MRLLLGLRKPHLPLEEALADAGCELQRWQPGEPPPEAMHVDAAVVDLCDLARRLRSAWRLRRRLAAARIPVIALDRDAPWHKGVRATRLRLVRALRLLDVYASHSLQDAGRFGAQPLYFPNAAWTRHYHLGERTLESLRDPAGYRYPVSFIGNLDARRYHEHAERVRFLEALRARLAQEGVTLHLFDAAGLPPAAQVALIQASRINLNAGAAADQGGTRSWGLPERCYGIPACGGFLLSDERRHAADDFVPQREWVAFASLEDCAAKIAHHLAHFEATRTVAEAAHRRVMRDHTYAARAQRLLQTIARLRASHA